MPMVTTDVGRNATVAADKGGFLVNLATFAVTEAPNVKLSVLDTALVGEIAYQGAIQSIEVVSDATVRLTLYLPMGFPAVSRAPDGAIIAGEKKQLNEIGIFLQSGELFAHGTFKTPFEKTGEFGLKLYVYVTEARLGEVVNVTFSSTFGLDSTIIAALIDSAKSGTNAVVVQDAQPAVGDLSSASLAMRFSAGGSKWAFTDHNMVYRGNPSTAAPGSFTLDVNRLGGFWLNDDEHVIVSVQAGPGVGETRRCKYNKSGNTFTVQQKNFSKLTSASVLNIWRANKNQLPSRTSDMPEYYTLGVGQNTWVQNAAASVGAFDRVQGQISIAGTGVAQLNLPTSVPTSALDSKASLLVFINGKHIDVGNYALSGRTLVLNTPAPSGSKINIVFYSKVDSAGSTLRMLAAEYKDYVRGTLQFQLGTLPTNKAGIMVFVDGLYIDPQYYNYSGSSITFINFTPEGVIAVISTVNYVETGATSTLIQSSLVLAAGAVAIAVGADSFDRHNTILTVDGKYVPHDDYTVSSRQVTLLAPYAKDVSVEVFIAAGTAAAFVPASAPDGINTGPVWQDPAGSVGSPNTLTPAYKTTTSTGATDYPTPPNVPSKDNILVFVGGQFQDPVTYTFDGSKVSLSGAPPAGQQVDVIGFASVKSKGSKASCRSFTLTTSANLTYNISGFTSGEPLLIFLGGVYQHRSTWSVSGGVLTFKSPMISGMTLEAWIFESQEVAGNVCAIATAAFAIVAGKAVYTMDISEVNETTNNVQNTLAFVASVFQSKSQYATTIPSAGNQNFTFPGGISKGVGKTLNTISFVSGQGKTRLITRDEFESRNPGEVGLPNGGGWAILPSGLMFQVGGGSTSTGYGDRIYFPVQFPNACTEIITSEGNAIGWGTEPHWTTFHGGANKNRAYYDHYCVGFYNQQLSYSGGVSYNYIAIGY